MILVNMVNFPDGKTFILDMESTHLSYNQIVPTWCRCGVLAYAHLAPFMGQYELVRIADKFHAIENTFFASWNGNFGFIVGQRWGIYPAVL